MPTPCLAVKIRFEYFLGVLDTTGGEGQIEMGHLSQGLILQVLDFIEILLMLTASGGLDTYYEFQDILAMGSLCRLRVIRNIICSFSPVLFSKDTAIFPGPLFFNDHYVRIYINGIQTTEFINQLHESNLG